MYKKSKWEVAIFFAIVFFSIFIIFSYLIYHHLLDYKNMFNLVKDTISNANTFMSICFGFYLTNLSVLFSSSYIKELNKNIDISGTQKQIYTVKNYFRNAIYCALLTILVGFIVLFLQSVIGNIYVNIITFSFFCALFMLNFYFIYQILKLFMNALIIESRS